VVSGSPHVAPVPRAVIDRRYRLGATDHQALLVDEYHRPVNP
jgi:hypothetical protein